MYQDYTGEMLGMLVKTVAGIGGNKIDIPSFHDLAYPEKTDTRTAEEIKAHVAALFK